MVRMTNFKVYSCSFSSDGKWIASCSFDKTINVWDVESKHIKTMNDNTSV